jgi:VWFA-related protein
MASHVLRPVVSFVAGLCLLAAPIVPRAQSQQQIPPAQQKPPVFRGGTSLVTVDVYPQRDGKIVEGLTAKDFTLLEDGTPQAIESIEFVRIEPALSDADRRDPNTQGEMLALAADPKNRVFVVFLDAQHTTVDGSHRIRRPLVETLQRVMTPSDLFGVITSNMDPRLLVLGRRTQGVEEQLSRYWPWGQRERITTDPENPTEERLMNCFEAYPTPSGWVPWYYTEHGEKRRLYDVLIDRDREDRALTALERTVEHLAGLREARTSVFIVSDGWILYERDLKLREEVAKLMTSRPAVFVGPAGQLGMTGAKKDPIDPATCNTELIRLASFEQQSRIRALISRANEHNITFYPVAPSGLGMFDVSPTTRKKEDGSTGMPLERNLDRRNMRIDTLKAVAENTDGLAVVNDNDLVGGLKRVIDDVSAYYLLTYYSTNSKNDGKFRKISVKTTAPGLHVRARRGYMAPSDNPSRSAAGAGAGARALVGAGAPAEITAALAPLSRLSPSTELFSRVVRDAAGLWIVAELPSGQAMSAPWNSGAELHVSVTDEAGAAIGEGTTRLSAPARGALVHVPIGAGAGATRALRVVSKLSAGGRTLEDRAEAPAPAASTLAGPPLLFRATPAATSPLRPVADLQYRRTERIHVQWQLSGPIDRQTARLLSRAGQPLAVPVRVSERAVDGRPALTADVNLAPLAAGDYVIELVVGRGADELRTLVGFRVLQ